MINNIQKDIKDMWEDEETEVWEQPLPKETGKPSFEKLLRLTETSPYIKKVLGELGVQDLDVKSRLEKLGNMFVDELRPLEAEGKILTAEEEEYKKTLNEFRTSIEGLYLAETGKELPVTTEQLKRADREYDLGEDATRLERGEKLKNPQAVAGVLERQNWGKILANLKTGDRVLSFLVPGADFLSIKYLNDKVFGPQETNKIIATKRITVEREVEQRLRGNAELIQNDYKLEIFRISEDSDVTQRQLEGVAKAVDEAMTAFVSKLASDLVKQERDDLKPLIAKRDEHKFENEAEKIKNDEEIKKHEEKINILKEFNNDLHGKSEKNNGKKGFKMTYGLSEEIKGEEPQERLLGLGQSLQTGRIARENHKGYGAEYEKENVLTELDKTRELREEIIRGGNTITDKDGNEFAIFIEKGDGRFALNKDVLRDVRKGKFQTSDGETLRAVSLYVKRLNVLDMVKPFVFEDLETAATGAEERKALAKKIRAGEELAKQEKIDTVKMLRAEEKDNRFTSKSEFSKQAMDMEKCAYISLDVLDLGADLLLEYESILQEIDGAEDDKKMEKFNEEVLKAGDDTTNKLKEFRSKVVEICQRDEFKNLGFGEGLIVAEVGGDELTLAADTGSIDEETMIKFLFALKKETNSRVIKTVVAKSEKNIFPDVTREKKAEAHLRALKRAEIGGAIAKDIEEAERKLNRLLQRQGEQAVKEKIGALRGLFVWENGQVKQRAVVLEKEGVFKIGKFEIANANEGGALPAPSEQFDYESIRDELDDILGKKTAAS